MPWANIADKHVVERKINVVSGTSGIDAHRFSVAKPIAQKMPDKKAYRSPRLSGWLADPPFDINNRSPVSATTIEIILALVKGSESQITPRRVAQTGVRKYRSVARATVVSTNPFA